METGKNSNPWDFTSKVPMNPNHPEGFTPSLLLSGMGIFATVGSFVASLTITGLLQSVSLLIGCGVGLVTWRSILRRDKRDAERQAVFMKEHRKKKSDES